MAHSLSFPYQASLAPNPAPHHQVSHQLLCENLQKIVKTEVTSLWSVQAYINIECANIL